MFPILFFYKCMQRIPIGGKMWVVAGATGSPQMDTMCRSCSSVCICFLRILKPRCKRTRSPPRATAKNSPHKAFWMPTEGVCGTLNTIDARYAVKKRSSTGKRRNVFRLKHLLRRTCFSPVSNTDSDMFCRVRWSIDSQTPVETSRRVLGILLVITWFLILWLAPKTRFASTSLRTLDRLRKLSRWIIAQDWNVRYIFAKPGICVSR